MATVRPEVICRNRSIGELLAFLGQVLIAISFQVGDDLARGFFAQRGTLQGVLNARRIAAYEAAHGFWVEPAWQTYFLQTRHLGALTIGALQVDRMMNGIYIFGHIFVTLGVAFWVYAFRRHMFAFLRNTMILINAFAILVYENFPVAPPRMTTGLMYAHHHFQFIDTVYGLLGGGKVMGTGVSYNEFSAMPSVHMAWALVAGGALLWLARPLWVRALGAIYPCLMLVAVVVTGNHYLLDALGGAVDVALALAVALCIERRSSIAAWVQGRYDQRPVGVKTP